MWAQIVPSLMALVGILISLAALKSNRQKIISVATIVLLFLLGLFTAAWAQRRSESAQQQRDSSIASLSSQLNIMAQYVLHPLLVPELQQFIIASQAARKRAQSRNLTTSPSASSGPGSPPGVAVSPKPSASSGIQEEGNQQLRAEVSGFARRLRDFENAFLSKEREVDLTQPMLLNEETADRDRRIQQQTIDRLQRLSNYESTYRKEYLPDALRLQGELIKRTPSTEFPEFSPPALVFGSPTGGLGGGPFLLGMSPLRNVADYLERLADRLPQGAN
jgi:hypothetical protein